MSKAQVWTDTKVLSRVGGLHVAAVGFFVSQDDAKPLPTAFELLVNLRLFGIEVGQTTVAPIANGPLTLPVGAGTYSSTILGEIDDWHGIGADHQPIASTDASWSTAAAMGFRVVAKADITIPLDIILAALPGISVIAKIAAGILGNKVTVTLAHDDIVIPLHKGAQNTLVAVIDTVRGEAQPVSV
jgi:hypothetical protein